MSAASSDVVLAIANASAGRAGGEDGHPLRCHEQADGLDYVGMIVRDEQTAVGERRGLRDGRRRFTAVENGM